MSWQRSACDPILREAKHVAAALGKSVPAILSISVPTRLVGTITDGGELTESYAIENGEVKMPKQELIAMI